MPVLEHHARIYVKEWRMKRGYSLAQLAGRATLAIEILDEIERGARGWTSNVITRIAGALDCAPADLLGRPPRD